MLRVCVQNTFQVCNSELAFLELRMFFFVYACCWCFVFLTDKSIDVKRQT